MGLDCFEGVNNSLVAIAAGLATPKFSLQILGPEADSGTRSGLCSISWLNSSLLRSCERGVRSRGLVVGSRCQNDWGRTSFLALARTCWSSWGGRPVGVSGKSGEDEVSVVRAGVDVSRSSITSLYRRGGGSPGEGGGGGAGDDLGEMLSVLVCSVSEFIKPLVLDCCYQTRSDSNLDRLGNQLSCLASRPNSNE